MPAGTKRKAKAPKVNRSQRIREVLEGDSTLKAQDIVAKLAEDGLKVSAMLVSQVRAKFLGKGKTGRKAMKGSFTMNDLKSAAEMAKKLGGVERASSIINFLSSLSL